MKLDRVKFEMELLEFASARGLELVEMPSFEWNRGWIQIKKSGSALWPTYAANGDIAEGFSVQFKPKNP